MRWKPPVLKFDPDTMSGPFLPLELPMNGFDVAFLFAAFLAAFVLAAWSAFLLFGV